MRLFTTLIARDLRLAFGRGGAALPVVFFLLVATLYPFGVGPDGALLAKTGGGVLWIAALLASLLPIDRLIAPDAESGVLDQLAVRGVSDEGVGAAKQLERKYGWTWVALMLMSRISVASAWKLASERPAVSAIASVLSFVFMSCSFV